MRVHERDGMRLDRHHRRHGVHAREAARRQPRRQLAHDTTLAQLVKRRFVAHVRFFSRTGRDRGPDLARRLVAAIRR
jgi:hypothetical protein